MTSKPFLNKSTAKQVLVRNFGSLERAKDKLDDIFLLHTFNSPGSPLTKRTILYLEQLGYGVALLRNICSDCGTHYAFSNLATEHRCNLCSNKERYKAEMIVEPETREQLMHNLRVLQKHFDTPDDTTYAELIEAMELDALYQSKV